MATREDGGYQAVLEDERHERSLDEFPKRRKFRGYHENGNTLKDQGKSSKSRLSGFEY